ncbi:MAG: DUF4367 domain-containing protein [Anaerolineales bacterium]|nr:DUF4367 domain-containing protein [Anaerolineales bacterium]
MFRNKNLWIIVGGVLLIAALISGFVLMQPSAQNMLVNTLESAKTITDGHAIVAFEVDSVEKDASGKVEVWAYREEEKPGGFRMEVLESSEAKAQGAVIVSDGETLWAYSPSENKVFVGTPEEARALMEENDFFAGRFGEMPQHLEGEQEHPENAQEAVQQLEEYFNIGKSGTQTIAGETANQLKLEPIPDQMPGEYIAVGGFINLWISEENNVPLAFEFTGSSIGEVSITVLEYEINSGVDNALFSFTVPESAELVTFADLEPQSLTLAEAGELAEFQFLTPTETPTGATLVDILEVRGALVQRYTLLEGGSFTIAQGLIEQDFDQSGSPSSESQPIEVRGTTGYLLEAEDGSQVLLTWTEGSLFYSVAGDLSAEQALGVAESLQ